MTAPTVRIQRNHRSDGWGGRWYWNVEWDDGGVGGVYNHGIGGWAATRLGARFAAWRELRRRER